MMRLVDVADRLRPEGLVHAANAASERDNVPGHLDACRLDASVMTTPVGETPSAPGQLAKGNRRRASPALAGS